MRKIQIHWSFVIVAALTILTGSAKEFGMFVLFVTLHEVSHIAAVKIFGGNVKSLRLTAIGEAAVISGLERMSVTRRYVVFLAGPAANIFLALFSFVFRLPNALAFNLLLGLFNLLPVFPLDGGRIAGQFIGGRIGTLRANRLLTRASRTIGLFIMFAGMVYTVLYPVNIGLLCVGMYLHQWNKRTIFPLTLDFFLQMSRKAEIKKGVVPVRLCAAAGNTPLSQIAERLDPDHFTHILIDNSLEKLLTEGEFITYILKNGLNGPVEEILTSRPPKTTPEPSCRQVFPPSSPAIP